MLLDHAASNEMPHPFTQNYQSGPTDPAYEPLSPPVNGTIDPSVLTYGNPGTFPQLNLSLIPQHNQSPTSQYIPEDSHYQSQPPDPSNSTDIWMGYPGDEDSLSELSPISPKVDGLVSAPLC